MFNVEAGAIIYYTGNSIEKVYTGDVISEDKLVDWQKTMREFNRVQQEMKKYGNFTKKKPCRT